MTIVSRRRRGDLLGRQRRGRAGRGLGRALTAAAVDAGFDLGADIASLQASPMGEPIYRAMGFETIYEYRLLMASPPGGARDEAAGQPDHPRGRRPRPGAALLRSARLGDGRGARTTTSSSSRRATWSSRSGTGRGSPRTARVEDRGGWGGVTLALNFGSPEEVDAAIEEARARRRQDRPRAGGDLLGRLQRRLPRPRRPPLGGRPQPALDADRGRRRPPLLSYVSRASLRGRAGTAGTCR